MATLDQLLEKAENAVVHLHERRTALISAAVTGKIDVHHWQLPESAREAIKSEKVAERFA